MGSNGKRQGSDGPGDKVPNGFTYGVEAGPVELAAPEVVVAHGEEHVAPPLQQQLQRGPQSVQVVTHIPRHDQGVPQVPAGGQLLAPAASPRAASMGGWLDINTERSRLLHTSCASTSHRLTLCHRTVIGNCKETSVSLHLIGRGCIMVGCNPHPIARSAALAGAPLQVGFVVRVQVADRPDSHPEMTFRYLRFPSDTALAEDPSVKPLSVPRALQGVARPQVPPLHSESSPESKRLFDHWVRDALGEQADQQVDAAAEAWHRAADPRPPGWVVLAASPGDRLMTRGQRPKENIMNRTYRGTVRLRNTRDPFQYFAATSRQGLC